ncbi:NPR2-domain-containing protein [Auriculariales sp. MPI-PUGE-AT-0066]|nr:NPR2-domain-containing protein [Auriculariales sp. MPI-PUGE-AT-0066]
MPPTDTFLPRIISIFYAIFHEIHGHQIVYQVPEGLIASGSSHAAPASPALSDIALPTPGASPERSGSARGSPRKPHSTATTVATLFDFPGISNYVLPPREVCGRLLTINVKNCAVMGFPLRVEGPGVYKRGYFQYSVCLVFDGAQSAELAPYEPVVRKIGRVLANCEQETGFLSSVGTSKHMRSILEQLYEDLNNYSEASVHIDAFNTLELKVFPFFPNPKPVYDWSVPVALVDFSKRNTEDWDLTVQRVYGFIDGVNHCAKIARLAQCDPALVRDAVSHLLYYQTVLLIDIFQYSNIYALRRPLSWLANSKWVMNECGPYVARSGCKPLDWPMLLELYSKFAGGMSVSGWLDRAGAQVLDLPDKVDIRRFVTFGVIKGFLRRLHRYPYYIKRYTADDETETDTGTAHTPIGPYARTPVPHGLVGLPTIESSASSPLISHTPTYAHVVSRRKSSTATDPGLGHMRGRQPTSESGIGRRASLTTRGPPSSVLARRQHDRSHSHSQHAGMHDTSSPVSPPDLHQQNVNVATLSASANAALSRSSAMSAPVTADADDPPKPEEFEVLLDGSRHCDELCIRFGVGWSTLDKWCDAAEGGKVHIVCR